MRWNRGRGRKMGEGVEVEIFDKKLRKVKPKN